jgi:hypothetical protein
VATNAPGRSAFNRVERRMAPLSRELAGLILSHDHYGSHLDSQGKTIDEELEKQNFEFAGKTLAELWSQVVIDGFPTISEYIDPEFGELRSERLHSKDLDWMAEHVRTSQYLTQIVKCEDINCCGKRRSPYFSFISSRFLPPPFPLQQMMVEFITKRKEFTRHFERYRRQGVEKEDRLERLATRSDDLSDSSGSLEGLD